MSFSIVLIGVLAVKNVGAIFSLSYFPERGEKKVSLGKFLYNRRMWGLSEKKIS